MHKFKKYLTQPYPYPKKKWRVLTLISLFVGVFIAFFQPFGLHHLQGNLKYPVMLGYGLITFISLALVMGVLPSLVPSFFNDKKWTLAREFLMLTLILFTIGVANFAYTIVFVRFNQPWWETLFMFQFFTLMVGVFPVAFVLIVNQNKLLKRNLQSAGRLNETLGNKSFKPKPRGDITLIAENEKDQLTLIENQLAYIETEGNYASVYYFNEGDLKHELLRSPLKRLQEQLAGSSAMFRCHRAFMVNLNHIVNVKGNAQGYRLTLKNVPNEVPVSRGYVAAFREVIGAEII